MATHTDHDTHEHPALDEPRPGHELRGARERAGITREFMAERLRLAVAQFDALEHDDYAELPPPAFVRGYFRVYARELGLEPDEYIAAYNRSGVSGRDPEIRSGGVTDTSSGGRGGMVGLLLIALVAAGGIGAWWYQQRTMDDGAGPGSSENVEEERSGTDDRESGSPESQGAAGGDTGSDDRAATDGESDRAAAEEGDTDPASATPADAADADLASVDADSMATTADDGDEAADDDTEQPDVVSPDRESLGNGGDDPLGDDSGMADTGMADTGEATTGNGAEEEAAEDTAATEDDGGDTGADTTPAAAEEPGANSPAATDSPTSAVTAAAGTGPDEVTLEFSARSWLEVYDDRDRELVYTLYFGSEPITLQGWAPFEIFLGNSPVVEVRFNGEAIDKSAFTRSNNTARFVVDASGANAP